MTKPMHEKPKPEEKRGLECRACGCRHFRMLYTRE